MFSFVGCEGDSDEVILTSAGGPENYSYPGGTTWLYVICEPEDNRPLKPVYVWRVSFNQNIIEEIVHDSEPKTEKKDEYSSFILSTEYKWPNSDELIYTCTNEGKYTFDVSLYDYDEYIKNKSTAKNLASYTHTVYCEKIKVSVKVSHPTEKNREYSLKATVENPKFIPYGSPPKWQFINNKTGIADTEKTEQITFDNDLYSNGRHEVVHQFQQSGEYKVIFTITKDGSQIASTQTIVDVSRAFQIIAPAGPLKTGFEYAFTARTGSPESLTESPSYEWDFGDGPGIAIPFSNEANHVFEKEGTYVIYLEVFESDEEAANTLGSAYLEVEVEASANHLVELHQMKKFSLDFAVQHDYIEGMSGRYTWDFPSYGEVVWDGVNFSMQWEQYNHSEVMTGRVSEDGTMIEQLKIRHEFKDSVNPAWYELEIQNLPFWTDNMPDSFIVSKSDEDVQNYVVYFNTNRTAGYQWTNDAQLYVRFTKQ